MKYVQLFTFLWAVVIVVEVNQSRGYGFIALGCIALAALIVKLLEKK